MLRAPLPNALPGDLAENVMHFGRVLRNAGRPVAADRIRAAADSRLRHHEGRRMARVDGRA